MESTILHLIDKLFELDALKLALLVLVAGAVGTAFVRYKNMRKVDRRTELRGTDIVDILSKQAAPIPPHWSKWMDDRINAKIESALIQPTIAIGKLEGAVSRLENQVEKGVKAINENNGVLERLIGRLLPNERIGGS